MPIARQLKAATTGIRKGSTNKVDTAIAVFEGAQKLYEMSKTYWANHYAYTVVVSEEDTLYPDVYAWILSSLPEERHRAISVGSTGHSMTEEYGGISDDSDGRSPVKSRPLVVRFDTNSTRQMVIGGYPVTLNVVVPESSRGDEHYRQFAKIQFVARSYEGQQAIIRELQRINDIRSTTRKAVLKMVGQWQEWRTRSDLPPRTMASVSLPEEQKDRIVKDLGQFLDAEEQYNRLAIPWHRGYMFHGPPGTGKTSLVKALACEFNLDLWYVSLSDLKEESSLIQLLAAVGPRSLLLLEDIDTVSITHDRDGAEQGKISMSSLLNVLDGVATPHGLITVMTTNRFEILDPAMTRAGRMDMVEELTWPTLQTLSDMFNHFYGRHFNLYPFTGSDRLYDYLLEGLSTAQVAELFKRHLDDSKAAELALGVMLDPIVTELVIKEESND